MFDPKTYNLYSPKRLQSDIVYDSKQISYVLNNIKLHELVAKYTFVRKTASGNYKSKCLICKNDNKHNHFVINRKTNKFKCFSTGISGNVINYIIQKDKIPFDKAINEVINIMNLNITLKPIKSKIKRNFFDIRRHIFLKQIKESENKSEDLNLPF